ncbi:alpha/beta hydrolase [Aetokthonos hydrillicola Thurmond2011]|jgi:hypothetical protein|uniref:Alpha/beta hydrolase n=1 Tax=Aetokthonos hydrillicola Thurmond2011 TaxID=2712845 RepID=A0AAP5IGP5_9CYAN|nr:hypothetical protein [Aetokthonos hydrillicola]MBW4585227.1 alpha/beta hydrolase [Aetokthonos hydrillicola CCALA 1050]MDR9899563.1 alpha/beta hydrolase [Aetokthonos hydrillicola Thurmond2011]
MAKIVGVHGISQEFRGSNTIHAEWLPALKDGLERAGATLESDNEFRCAFYGDLFRGHPKSVTGIPNYDASDINSDWEKKLLQQWWDEAAKVENGIKGSSDLLTQKATSIIVQQALSAVSNSKFFGGVAEKIVIFFLKQVHDYLHNHDLREQIRERVVEAIDEDTRVLVGHSLGSIVCYETLCQHPELSVKVFVTLGSPLGIKRLIFDRLEPLPHDNLGHWPESIERWINIADKGDIVALEKQLNPLFNGFIEDKLVHNGSTAHDAKPYFTAAETGEAIKLGLID